MTPFDHRFATVAGRRIHYLEAGEGPPMLLLHSGGASAYEWEHCVAPLAAHRRVVAWDMPGHGDGDRLTAHFTVGDHADVLAGLIDALDLDGVTLVGASFGGYIALDYLNRRDHRARNAVIVEAPLRSPQWYADNWAMFEAMCAIPETPADALAKRVRTVTPELLKRWNMDRWKAGSWTIVDLAWAARDFDAATAFQAARAPLRVVLGSDGPTVAERGRLEGLRPDATIVELGGCGHFPMIDDPARLVAALLDMA